MGETVKGRKVHFNINDKGGSKTDSIKTLEVNINFYNFCLIYFNHLI